MVWLSVVLSVSAHAAVFAFGPTLYADEIAVPRAEITAIEIPPELEIPPPPQPIARPATPVSATLVDQDVTIAPTTFEQNPVEELPPPPDLEASDLSRSEPVFTPYTVSPRVLNAAQVVQLLDAEYPRELRNALVGGRVVVWFSLDEEGAVTTTRLDQTSGFPELDRAALRVAERVQFSPALNGDKPAPVWIRLPLEFQAR